MTVMRWTDRQYSAPGEWQGNLYGAWENIEIVIEIKDCRWVSRRGLNSQAG